MEIKAEDYAKMPRDSRHERKVTQLLRQWPEEERYQFVNDLLGHDELVGLRTASSTLQQKCYFEALLERGLRDANISSLSHWLECVVPKLGFRKVSLLLTGRVETDFDSVKKALYWLPRLKPQNDVRADVALSNLRSKLRIAEMVRDMGTNEMVFIGNGSDVAHQTATPRVRKQNAPK